MKGYSLSLSALFVLFLCGIWACKSEPKVDSYRQLTGQTWGTYYSITFKDDGKTVLKSDIDKILKDFDQAASTYVADSYISQLNKTTDSIFIPADLDKYFHPVFTRSNELESATNGYLNVKVMPLLNYWGFGYNKREEGFKPNPVEVERLRNLLSKNIRRKAGKDGATYIKDDPRVEIDYSATAKGYGIDVLAAYLDQQGIENYLVDIGGEARAKGVNSIGQAWTMAINKPYAEAKYTAKELILKLPNRSIATSGNYRKMYEKDGKVYGHIVNPMTGYPEGSDVLSASIIADDCMTADGIATACIAAGLEKSKQFLSSMTNVSACLIYDGDGDTQLEKVYINNFEQYVLEDMAKATK